MYFSHRGKNLYTLAGIPVMKTCFSLLRKVHREYPVFITGMGLQCGLQKFRSEKQMALPIFFQSILQRSSRTQDILPSEISDALKCLFDGLELSKQLKFLVSKQSIEDCFLFFSYCIGLMCRFVAFMLLKYQVCPSYYKVMI